MGLWWAPAWLVPPFTATQIEMFGTALDTFRLDVGRYPTMEEGLKALREKPSGVEGWQGPYLPKELPVDPWNKPYIYKCPGEHGDYDLLTYGLDGTEGGEGENQDVVSWKDVRRRANWPSVPLPA